MGRPRDRCKARTPVGWGIAGRRDRTGKGEGRESQAGKVSGGDDLEQRKVATNMVVVMMIKENWAT